MNGPYNVVTTTNPSGGTKVAKGSTVTLNYNVRPGAQALPDVSGLTVSEATAKLSKAGWKDVTESATPVASLKFKNDEVVSTNPSAGADGSADTQIVLNVSGDGVAVPALGRALPKRCHRQAEPGGPCRTRPSPLPGRRERRQARSGSPRRAAGKPRCTNSSVTIYVEPGTTHVAEPVDLAEYQPESEPVTE